MLMSLKESKGNLGDGGVSRYTIASTKEDEHVRNYTIFCNEWNYKIPIDSYEMRFFAGLFSKVSLK